MWSLSSHPEQLLVQSRSSQDLGIMIRKTLITNHPWLPVRITAPAQFDALDPSNKKYTHTHTHHTRFYSLGWAWVCGWGADDETASTVEGESAEVKRKHRGSHDSPCT